MSRKEYEFILNILSIKQNCFDFEGFSCDAPREWDGCENCIKGIEMAIEAIHELQYYKDLEEQGRLIELPCAKGDKIFYATKNRIIECFASKFEVAKSGLYVIATDCHWKTGMIPATEFGVYAFLTKEEAEEALKRLQGNE